MLIWGFGLCGSLADNWTTWEQNRRFGRRLRTRAASWRRSPPGTSVRERPSVRARDRGESRASGDALQDPEVVRPRPHVIDGDPLDLLAREVAARVEGGLAGALRADHAAVVRPVEGPLPKEGAHRCVAGGHGYFVSVGVAEAFFARVRRLKNRNPFQLVPETFRAIAESERQTSPS